MQKKIIILLTIILNFALTHAIEKTILRGTIQFPTYFTVIPSVKVRSAGSDISSESFDENKQVIFNLPTKATSTFFYLVIAKQIHAAFKENNTVTHYTVPSSENYSAYALEYQMQADDNKSGAWVIHQFKLPTDRRIPDDALIIHIDPDFIEKIEGGNSIEFPTVFLKNSLLESLGSQQAVLDTFAKTLLATIDNAAFYSSPQHIVSRLSSKTIAVMTV